MDITLPAPHRPLVNAGARVLTPHRAPSWASRSHVPVQDEHRAMGHALETVAAAAVRGLLWWRHRCAADIANCAWKQVHGPTAQARAGSNRVSTLVSWRNVQPVIQQPKVV